MNDRNRKPRLFSYIGAPIFFAVIMAPPVFSEMNHSFLQQYEGSKTCAQCHGEKIDEVMDSVHYAWRTPNDKIGFPGGGSHGMIDRFCALVGSNAIVNFTGDFGGHTVSSSCGKCHISTMLPFPDPQTGEYTQTQRDSIDCLICHAEKYDMNGDGVYDEPEYAGKRTLMTDENGMRYWHQDRSLETARTVGSAVTAEACYRCHEHGQADPSYKRGTPFEPEHDVHAAAGMNCTRCHEVEDHKIARGSRVSDMHAWERQDVEVDCTNCHNAPHDESAYNMHTSFIACETCHIPYISGVARRVWTSTYGVTEGPEANIPQLDPETGMYEPYSDFLGTYDQRPSYRWFNGNSSMLAEPVHDPAAWDFQPATKETPNAKIYPFRKTVSGMVMDRKGIGMDPEFDPSFTMKAALEAMTDNLIAFGFMRPEGLTEAEKQVLANFPNLLAFDKEHYLHTGQVDEAVSIGLAKQGLMFQGQNPAAMTTEELIAIGSQMWSGSSTGLDLPDNPADPTYVDDMDPTTVTGSFISLNHAIKREGALTCENCHSSQSVLNFKALHFSDERARELMSMFDSSQVDEWNLY
ncbi:MAG: hypothetical protein JXR73_17635 [Candidatus Omnitrophica bacterium]|nr:hypothetical protein [Candidatus Omnitrophota bacterium]